MHGEHSTQKLLITIILAVIVLLGAGTAVLATRLHQDISSTEAGATKKTDATKQ